MYFCLFSNELLLKSLTFNSFASTSLSSNRIESEWYGFGVEKYFIKMPLIIILRWRRRHENKFARTLLANDALCIDTLEWNIP